MLAVQMHLLKGHRDAPSDTAAAEPTASISLMKQSRRSPRLQAAFASAPVPVAMAIGMNPKDATKAVINTGRRRDTAPVCTAFGTCMPVSRNARMDEINTSPFNTATQIAR